MVCHGPDPPDNNPHDLIPPHRADLIMNGQGEESDEEHDHFGYEPLPQGPEAVHSDHDSDDEAQNTEVSTAGDIPSIESMDNVITRQVWNAPRNSDAIQMDNERAQQVMRAMANFALPAASIPEWAQSMSEDQWKQTLNDRIEILKNNR